MLHGVIAYQHVHPVGAELLFVDGVDEALKNRRGNRHPYSLPTGHEIAVA